jgi:hypothetical protein
MKKLLVASLSFLTFYVGSAQTLEELKAEKAAKKDSIEAIEGRINELQGRIDKYPGWKIGAFGTLGANLSNFNNWYAQGVPNNSSGNIGITVNAFANLDREKFFWRNSGNANLQWVKLDNEDVDTDSEDFEGTTDVFTLSSLYGYKLGQKFAISALGEYRTSIINNFNNPGYLDLGVGGTWRPIENLVVVVHPLNYNFVFAENETAYQSSAGAKIVADYTRKFGKLNLKSNFSTFQSYESSTFSNWTWINSAGYTLWKGIGLGFELGLRSNHQEVLANALAQTPPPVVTPTFENTDNELQTYWLFGLNYSF